MSENNDNRQKKISFRVTADEYDKDNSIYVPKWKLEEIGEGNERYYRIYYFNVNKGEYRIVAFIEPYINAHLRYLSDNNSHRIAELLDDGTIYLYLMRLNRKSTDYVYDRVENLQTNNEFYEKGNSSERLTMLESFMSDSEEKMFSKINK